MPEIAPEKYATYAEFWPFYLSQHRAKACRALHITGTFLTLTVLLFVIFHHAWLWLLIVPVVGYGLAWPAHMFIEKNKPATFVYPIWSLRGDFHMFWLWLTGALADELRRTGIEP